MRYFKYHWDESPGGEIDHWGKSDWYMELDNDGWTIRQIQIFDNGPKLKYDLKNKSDEYGMLNDQKTDIKEFVLDGGIEITHDVFENKWSEK